MATLHEPMECPFCGYQAASEYPMRLHMEEQHAEDDSPSASRSTDRGGPATGGRSADDKQDDYAKCPIEGCGEWLMSSEMAFHVDLHAQEEGLDDPGPAASDRNYEQQTSDRRQDQQQPTPPQDDSRQRRRQHRNGDGRDGTSRARQKSEEPTNEGRASSRRSTIQAWRDLLGRSSSSSSPTSSAYGSRRCRNRGRDGRCTDNTNNTNSTSSSNPPASGPAPQRVRLGKNELGKYAHEEVMPAWLIAHLREGGQIKADGILTVLEQLLEQSPTTRHAYLCHPAVQHISKLKKEGGFCGYRNQQMLMSFILKTKAAGAHHFQNNLPSVFQIQDWIEEAWDKGINAHGRIETGGVRMTRKYIGTSEAQAVFMHLNIPCETQGYKNRNKGNAEARLSNEERFLSAVERYFETPDFDPRYKVRRTNLPPLYFQHAGHSMTIVGLERLKEGGANLIVFDPMFRDSNAIVKLVSREFEHRFPDLALKPYRRGHKYLKKYDAFEIMKIAKLRQTQASSSSAA